MKGDPRFLPLAACAAAALLLALGRPAAASVEEEVQHWLDRMARAVETLNYRGTLVHIREGRMDTLRIIHRADDNGVRERIYSVDGERREVLRDGNKVRCLLPGDQPQALESHLARRLLPNLPVNRLTSPESAYHMALSGRERVAGMMARIVIIKPRDQYRYGYRLWLEERTGMLLRYALTDGQDRQLQQLSFTSIELGVPISDAELKPDMPDAARVLTTRLDEPGGPLRSGRRSGIEPRVPEGFHLVNAGHGRGASGDVFRHLLFSDGLASFSIYIEDASVDGVGSRIETIGPVHIFTARAQGRMYTVVGEVPSATVRFVGRQFHGDPKSSQQPAK